MKLTHWKQKSVLVKRIYVSPVSSLLWCVTLQFIVDKDGKVSWEEFKKGHFTDDGKDEDSKEQIKEDEEKFKFADEDGDGKLDLEEYLAFYHPGVSNTWLD